MQFPESPNYYCRFCNEKMGLVYSVSTSALIRHMEDHHELEFKPYKDIPISDMIKKCFKRSSEEEM